jgi:release factor glutamine methyltransferase
VSGAEGVLGDRPPRDRWATSVADALHSAMTAIAASGSDTPRLDAELLLAHALGVTRERLLIDRDGAVTGPAIRVFQECVRRRAIEREPVAYITGRRAFRYIELEVDRRALIPRPETELLVELSLRLPQGSRVLDVGTGSGAVALALKHERPDLRVTGSDVSPPALVLARANAQRLGLDVEWLVADLLNGIEDRFDAIVANPPYVAERERSQLAPEIVRHEPPQALFAGADGLPVIAALVEQAAGRSTRLLAIEVGAGQAERVRALCLGAGFAQVRAERDLAGIERVLVAERSHCSRDER